jgi:uroporphyrinogen decarboxylase
MQRYYAKLIDTNRMLARKAIEAGTDGILIADDLAFNSGTFVDPAYLRSDYFPLLKAQVQEIRAAGLPVFFHSDGDLRTIIPDLIDCGINVLQSCDPNAGMDIPALKQQYGSQLAFMGNIDVDLLAHGTPVTVSETTRKLVRTAGPGGGFILSAANVVAKYCQPANVLAMYAAAHELELR